MKNNIPAIAGLVASLAFASSAFAQPFDLTQTMKKMRFEFKQAAEAENIEQMQQPIVNLAELVEQSKQAEYPVEKQELYMEGFKKLAIAIDGVEAQIEAGDLEQAQELLREVDDLRIEYHDRRNPSIWSRLFG